MKYELRKWKISDAEDIVKYANNPKIAANLRDGFPYPYTIDNAKFFINACLDKNNKNYLRAITINNKIIGSIGVMFKDDIYKKSAEIGYWLAEPFWRKGIMSEVIIETSEYIFNNYDIIRIYAEPFATNIGSRKVLENAGFTLEGILLKSVFKNGVILDSCIYAKIK